MLAMTMLVRAWRGLLACRRAPVILRGTSAECGAEQVFFAYGWYRASMARRSRRSVARTAWRSSETGRWEWTDPTRSMSGFAWCRWKSWTGMTSGGVTAGMVGGWGTKE